MEGSQWMIFRNTITNVLHWDFVRRVLHEHFYFFLYLPRVLWAGLLPSLLPMISKCWIERDVSSADNCRYRATANIQFNVTQLGILAAEWSSDELMGVHDALNQNTTDANVGNLAGNHMFYANDYMVWKHFLYPNPFSHRHFPIRFSAVQAT